MVRSPWSFSSVLGTITPEVFRRDYWGKQWLHLGRAREDFYEGLITLAEIERYLSMHEAFARHSISTPRQGYGMPDPPPASLSEVCERVMAGSSLRIRRMECFLDPAVPLMSLVRDMVTTLQHPLESLSCYVARAGGAGLGPHHDDTEIVTLQIAGRKRWRLYHRNTCADHAATYDPASLGEPAHELTLEPGDLLYTPRGLIHDVEAEAAAFSITIVFDPFTWRSLLEMLSARLSPMEAFQTVIPAGAVMGDEAPDALEHEVKNRLEFIRAALDTISSNELVDMLAERLISRMTWSPGTRQMTAVLDGEITLDTVVERNSDVPCHLARWGDRVRLTLAGGYTIQASVRAEPALRAVLAASTPFALADMHESLGDAAKLAFAKKLVASGVLRRLESGAGMKPAPSLSGQEVLRALDAARARLEKERRERFIQFGIPEDCLWPCSQLFHSDSSLGPAWQPALNVAEIEQHTLNLDYKRYPDALRVALPRATDVRASLASAIRERRSIPQFSSEPVSVGDLAALLELGVGVTRQDAIPRRAAPSGGALYPVETYVFAFAVSGLAAGLYHYVPLDGVLEQVRLLPEAGVAVKFLPPGLSVAEAPLLVALSAVFERTQLKYLERGYRFALLEAGHMAQNLLLLATALGLNAVPVGGFWDEPFNEALGFDAAREAAIYAVLCGHGTSETK